MEPTPNWLLKLMDHRDFDTLVAFLLGAIAIIASAIVLVTLTRLLLTHRQRMAMIRQGMHPDAYIVDSELPPPESPADPAA